MKSTSAQILGCSDFESVALTETHHHLHQKQHTSSGFGDGFSVDGFSADAASIESGKIFPQIEEDHTQLSPLAHCKLNSQKDCNPTEQGKQEDEGAFGVTIKHDCSIEREECATVTKDGSESAFNTTCREKQSEEHETENCIDDNNQVNAHVDVNPCISHMGTLSVNTTEVQKFHEGQGELSPINKDMQTPSPCTQTASGGLNDDVSNLSNEKKSEEQSSVTPPPRKPAAWRTPEPKARIFPEPEFIMEASSWPTLAEARHVKPSEARSSPPQKETISVSSPPQKVLSSQENFMEAPKHSNNNPPQPGSKYRSSYKKGNVPGYSKPSFPSTENIPLPPMGVHVPSANMSYPDQSMKGNGFVGMNNFFPGPHQAPANGPFYHHRGEGLAPFPHNSVAMPPYGRGHQGWQHHGRGYSDANYKHSGFLPAYDQQHIGPRHMHPPMAPFMNVNAAHYNYPNYPASDMSYMPPSAFSPGYNYGTPYFGPPGPSGGVMQGYDLPTLLVMLQRQIEYYFSKENLIRDIFLTSKMDEEGFVPVSLIASFPRVRKLTLNSMLILEALKNSSVVEVKNGKLRSHEWRRRLSDTSQTHGIENLESSALLGNTGVDHAREQGTVESEEGGSDKMSTLPESKLIAGSFEVPWTGLSANLGAINVPAVTSIDSR